MGTSLRFLRAAAQAPTPKAHVIIGSKQLLTAQATVQANLPSELSNILSIVSSGQAETASHWIDAMPYTVAHLDSTSKRNLGFIRGDRVESLARSLTPKEKDTEILLLLESKRQAKAAAYALARAFPLLDLKSKEKKDRTVSVKFQAPETISESELEELQVFTDGVRQAARRVDTPTCFLNTHVYLEEIQAIAAKHPEVQLKYFKDEETREQGLTALWAVGKCAEHGPVFVELSYKPANAKPGVKLGLVGKGIVYDTGGLQIKPGASMTGMKADMGGSAAILSAFESLVATKFAGEVVAVLCIAENAIGPKAYRNDDVVTSYSGKTIEINNTDAEGRVVLSDGVAWITKNHNPTHLIDMATLTGAQLMNTGVYHAALLSPDESFERVVYDAGQSSGDWCFPILYAPEILVKEFDSQIADMKNSVKDRMNAQASCAGHFIESHLHPDWKGAWAHVDIAGPSFRGDRATGHGVGLIIDVAHRLVAGP